MIRPVSLTAAAFLTLVACGSPRANDPVRSAPVEEPPAMETSGNEADKPLCNTADAQFAIGREADPALVESARVAAHAGTARVLRPGQMVTMEHNAARLTIYVDESNVVRRMKCG
jgi:hypothetical protein